MKLTVLGSRGYIEVQSRRHRRHASLLVEYRGGRAMIDCGEDWDGRIPDIDPDVILITHAHPDHAFGLRSGTDVPVYATSDTWEALPEYPVSEKNTIPEDGTLWAANLQIRAFAVEHSTHAPAVGYRMTAGRVHVFYAPDLVYIHQREAALEGCRLYIGDGAALTRSLVRKREPHLIGHTPVRTQLTWCQKTGVPEMWVTHCGGGIVEGDERRLGARLRKMARERGVEAVIAHDGMTRVLRS